MRNRDLQEHINLILLARDFVLLLAVRGFYTEDSFEYGLLLVGPNEGP